MVRPRGALRAEGRGRLALTTMDLRCCLAPPFLPMAGRRDDSCFQLPRLPERWWQHLLECRLYKEICPGRYIKILSNKAGG